MEKVVLNACDLLFHWSSYTQMFSNNTLYIEYMFNENLYNKNLALYILNFPLTFNLVQLCHN